MKREYWAQRGKQKSGPHESRDAAIASFRTAFPCNGPDYEARAVKNQILTGYGSSGPLFDLRWHDAREIAARTN